MAQSITLNMIPNGIPPRLKVSQYDVGRTITINLCENSSDYQIPSGASVVLHGTKPSTLGFSVNCTYSGSAVTVVSTEEMTDECGVIPAEISITLEGTVLGSLNVELEVEESPHKEGTTDGTGPSVVSTVTALVERAETACEGAETALESMQTLDTEATTLAAGSEASAEYDAATNTITFGIPRGTDGSTITFADESSDGNIVITAS